MGEKSLVPKLRFTGFDDEWNSYFLEDVIKSFVNGQTPSRNVDSYWNGKIPWVSSGELNYNHITSTIEQITEEGKDKANLKLLPAGTFLMAITGLEAAGTRGSCAILDIEATTNQSCMALFPKEDKLTTKFLYYWYLKVGEHYGIKYTQGTKQQSYNKELLEKLPIIIPNNLKEQNKITDFLSLLNLKIELLENKHEFYVNFKKYLMQQIFAQNLRFDENCQYATKKVKDFLVESKIEGTDDINKRLTVKLNLKGITIRESKTIEIEGATKQFIRKSGQFIYGKQNLHKGAFGIVPKELDGYLTSSDIPSFDFKGEIEPKWFYYYFSRKSFYEKLESLSTGTGSKRISPKEFLNIKIIVPEIEEQHRIVYLLEKFDEKINGISNQITQMDMFKKSLLQQMFI